MFQFKQFSVRQEQCAMKVGTDGVLLGAWAEGGIRILDVGTGTGIMALMMAQRYPEAQVTGIDIDEGAVCQALENVAASPFAGRVTVELASVQTFALAHEGCYDVVVSNPPFFIHSLHAPDRQRDMARHTTTMSYTDLMEAACRLLTTDGELSVIVPFDYRQRMEDEATFVGLFPHRVCAVRTKADQPAKRFLLSFVRHPVELERTEMTIGDVYYQHMTRDFYLE